MRTFAQGQRVLVKQNEDGIPINAPGTVRRIRTDGSAFVDLDVRSKNAGIHPFSCGDACERSVVASPGDCEPSTESHADRRFAALINAEPKVTLERFGKDHWSTFGYIEIRCTDHGGRIDIRRMRCDADRHPLLAHTSTNRKYPTRLAGGVELHDHDDWDCADDLEALGLIESIGTTMTPAYRMTAMGQKVAAMLRAHKQNGGAFGNFRLSALPDAEKKLEPQVAAP